MSITKCVLEPTTRLVLLGIIYDTEARRFEVPEGNLLKLEVGFFRRPRALGREVHKHVRCRSTCHFVHVAYLQTHREVPPQGGRVKAAMIAVQKGRGVSYELHTWREVRHRMNRASWYDATHHSIKLRGATDASSSGWGGIVRGPFKSFSV